MFLIDNNRPPSLRIWLNARGIEAQHVRELGLAHSLDPIIWRYSVENELAILTKDRDFDRFAKQSRDAHLPVFRLQIGNATNQNLFSWLEPRLQILLDFQQGRLNPNAVDWPELVLIE